MSEISSNSVKMLFSQLPSNTQLLDTSDSVKNLFLSGSGKRVQQSQKHETVAVEEIIEDSGEVIYRNEESTIPFATVDSSGRRTFNSYAMPNYYNRIDTTKLPPPPIDWIESLIKSDRLRLAKEAKSVISLSSEALPGEIVSQRTENPVLFSLPPISPTSPPNLDISPMDIMALFKSVSLAAKEEKLLRKKEKRKKNRKEKKALRMASAGIVIAESADLEGSNSINIDQIGSTSNSDDDVEKDDSNAEEEQEISMASIENVMNTLAQLNFGVSVDPNPEDNSN